MKLVFNQIGTFKALDAARQWCRENGISFGSTSARGPVALLRGDYIIAKWHNLSGEERAALDGTMTGDYRNGPVTIDLRDEVQQGGEMSDAND